MERFNFYLETELLKGQELSLLKETQLKEKHTEKLMCNAVLGIIALLSKCESGLRKNKK